VKFELKPGQEFGYLVKDPQYYSRIDEDTWVEIDPFFSFKKWVKKAVKPMDDSGYAFVYSTKKAPDGKKWVVYKNLNANDSNIKIVYELRLRVEDAKRRAYSHIKNMKKKDAKIEDYGKRYKLIKFELKPGQELGWIMEANEEIPEVLV